MCFPTGKFTVGRKHVFPRAVESSYNIEIASTSRVSPNCPNSRVKKAPNRAKILLILSPKSPEFLSNSRKQGTATRLYVDMSGSTVQNKTFAAAESRIISGSPGVKAPQSRSIAPLSRDSDASGIWMQLRETRDWGKWEKGKKKERKEKEEEKKDRKRGRASNRNPPRRAKGLER